MHPWNRPILEALERRLDTLPHALLVHGPRGIGKLALAERIAQAVLCEAPSARPCGTCEGCRWFAAGTHPDFRRVEPEALMPEVPVDEEAPAAEPARKGKPSLEIKIGQVRELADFLNVGSHRGRRRVALVHPAEDMNLAAANALLKGLEEPPGGAMFILVSHRPARLLPTIRSRCVGVPVPRPPGGMAVEWLRAQGVQGPERWLAYAGGAPLLAAELASQAPALGRWLAVAQGRDSALPETREDLEALVDALQKVSVDRVLAGFGLPAKYGTAGGKGGDLLGWLRFARRMGEHRALVRHPLNPKLFAAQVLGEKPEK